MSQAEQAQKGFKTFILTLAISLIVFSAIYYFITNASSSSSAPDIESTDKVSQNVTPSTNGSQDTPFSKLAAQRVTDVQPQVVLAAATTAEPTQSTGTPNGGVESITLGLITSVAIFLFGMYVIAKDPRRMALREFENKITKNL